MASSAEGRISTFPTPHNGSTMSKGTRKLQTLDTACEKVHSLLDSMQKQSLDWNARTFRDTGCFLAHAERDGIVYKQDKLSQTDMPQRATSSKMCIRMQVAQHMGNPFGVMHGGCIATVVDSFSSCLVRGHSA